VSHPNSLVLVYAQDLGGARAILPVVQALLQDRMLSVRVLVHDRAARLFSEAGIPVVPLHSMAQAVPLTQRDALQLVKRLAPALLFTATSHPRDPSNGYLVAAAREAGVPTVAMADHWKGEGRFRPSADGPLLFAPDVLGVMDRRAYETYLAEGLSPERVRIVGHPYLEQIFGDRRQWCKPDHVATLKRRAGLKPETSLILFCSETVHDHDFHESCRDTCLPLPEVPVRGMRLLDLLQGAVAETAAHSGKELHLALRPHPNQTVPPCTGVRIIDQETLSDVEAVAVSAAVVGLSTMPLIEASLLGKPAASLAFFDGWDPSRVFFGRSSWNTQPYFTVLNKAENLGSFLTAAVGGAAFRPLPLAYERQVLIGATGRCLELIKAELGVPRAEGAAAR